MSKSQKRIISVLLDKFPGEMVPTDGERLVEEFESALGFALPRDYRMLIAGYQFPDLGIGEVALWGTVPDEWDRGLIERVTEDKGLFEPLRAAGYVYIGRPESGIYDPVCISNERAIVRVDHEQRMQHNKTRVVERYAKSLYAFVTARDQRFWMVE